MCELMRVGRKGVPGAREAPDTVKEGPLGPLEMTSMLRLEE